MTLPPSDSTTRMRALARARGKVAVSLTIAMIAIYFGFIALIAFRKDVLARTLTPGLSVGILLGALVIVSSWLLTWVYVRWSNRYYDEQMKEIGRGEMSR